MKRLFCLFLGALMLPVLWAAPAWSLTAKEGDALQERVERLEKRLQEVEGKPRAAVEKADVETKEKGIRFGGAFRVNYSFLDWDEGDDERIGDFDFDTFRLNMAGELGGILFDAEYRFYPQYDFSTPHHGWIGYNFTENLQGQLGIHQVPFGLQPFASHSYWFSGAYYIGLEDDYDMGIKFLYDRGPWNFALAFYKNEELGDPSDAGRYSIDIIDNADGGFAGAQPAGNRENNQVNGRVAYTFDHGDLGDTEVGLSGQWGQLYNNITGDNGDRWAAAVHLNGNYGRWNVQLEYAPFEWNPENPESVGGVPIDDDIITMGGYSFSWGVPAKGQFGIFNLAYKMPVTWGPIESLTFYSDNTVIEPDEERFSTIWQNVVGCLVAAGPLYTYIDVISGRDMIFMGGDMVGDTDASSGRNTRLNVNFGFYF